jgi:hypothetical protein
MAKSWIGNKRLTKAEKEEIRKEIQGHTFSWYKQKEREKRKERTIRMVNIEFNTNIDDDDVADSVAIGWYASKNWNKLVDQPSNT